MLYQKELLHHYKFPQNYGKIEKKGVKIQREFNPLCGDEITLYLLVEKNTIKDIKFEGRGCVISRVAASIISEKVKGKNITLIEKMTPIGALKMTGLEDIASGRIKCALLFYKTLKKIFYPVRSFLNSNSG